jgi:hypothetical protein
VPCCDDDRISINLRLDTAPTERPVANNVSARKRLPMASNLA